MGGGEVLTAASAHCQEAVSRVRMSRENHGPGHCLTPCCVMWLLHRRVYRTCVSSLGRGAADSLCLTTPATTAFPYFGALWSTGFVVVWGKNVLGEHPRPSSMLLQVMRPCLRGLASTYCGRLACRTGTDSFSGDLTCLAYSYQMSTIACASDCTIRLCDFLVRAPPLPVPARSWRTLLCPRHHGGASWSRACFDACLAPVWRLLEVAWPPGTPCRHACLAH